MTAKTIIQAVCGDLGITSPNAVAGSSDLQVTQLLSLLNSAGRALARRHDWQALIKEQTFAAVATESQGLLVDLIDEPYYKILNETIWNRTQSRRYCGPSSARDYQAMQTLAMPAVFGEYRIRGGALLLLPAPTVADTIAFEYKSRYWAESEAGAGKDSFTADDDEPRLDEQLLILDLKWRWLKAKGLEYAEEFNEAEAAIVDAIGPDGTSGTLSLAPGGDLSPGIYVPTGNWPLT